MGLSNIRAQMFKFRTNVDATFAHAPTSSILLLWPLLPPRAHFTNIDEL